MADVKWIKITTDIFDDEKILLIETLPDADAIIVIWFKLLCLAGKQNNTVIRYNLNIYLHFLSRYLAGHTFFAGMGAGLGTGFAGMSAAAVISPMLITFLGVDPYMAVGIVLSSDVLASAVSAYTYHKTKIWM